MLALSSAPVPADMPQANASSMDWPRCNAHTSPPTKLSPAPTALTGASHVALLTSAGLVFARDADPNDSRLRVFGSSVSGSFDELDYCILAVAMWIEEL